MRKIIHDVEIKNMIRLANDAKDRAYAPYTNFQVGACLKAGSGAYYMGCNIENVSPAASICAERVALYRAIAETDRTFEILVTISSGSQPMLPCGVCRQVLAELCDPDLPVICANRSGKYQIYYLGDLMPQPITREDMK